MAIDDVVSDWDLTATAGSRISIQPASGDEWMVTHVMTLDDWNLNSHTNSDNFDLGPVGGNTAVTDHWATSGGGVLPVRMFLTNSEYVRFHNDSGGQRGLVFSAIKTKE